jgi:predicted DsbA family dithiol-disulfide isomerase
MTRLRVPVHYDFASTLCYVAHRVMERMRAELDALDVELVWSPVDLTQISGWRRGEEVTGVRRANALRVASELGVAVRMPARWMDSRRAAGVALALAGDAAREAAWRERVWSAVFEEGRVLDDPGELERLAGDLGFDVGPALASERRLDELQTRTLLAIEAGVTAVPTFMLGGFPLGGIQTEETMRSLLGRWASKQRARSA